MPRARQILYVSYAEVRRLHGRETYTAPSRFLGEVPPEMIEEVRPGVVRSAYQVNAAGGHDNHGDPVKLGGRVRHNSFGEGVVLSVEGRGEHTRVQVNFESVGNKWLVLAYANLEML